jgi:hypothetical protein
MKLVLLCGAGGTGKSTVTMELSKHKDVTVMRSSSRDTYLRLGIPTETAAFGMDLNTQKMLQDEIMKDHMKKLDETVQSMRQRNVFDNGILVVDRSPFDHMAYWTRTNALDVNSKADDFAEGISKVCHFIDTRLMPEVVGFFDFPYPTRWSTDDGMRDQNEIKTLEMSLLTTGLIQRYHTRLQAPSFYREMPFDVPELRRSFIVEELKSQPPSPAGYEGWG